MIKVTIRALYTERQEVIGESIYDSEEECMEDLKMMRKPSMFGNCNFRIEIERV